MVIQLPRKRQAPGRCHAEQSCTSFSFSSYSSLNLLRSASLFSHNLFISSSCLPGMDFIRMTAGGCASNQCHLLGLQPPDVLRTLGLVVELQHDEQIALGAAISINLRS